MFKSRLTVDSLVEIGHQSNAIIFIALLLLCPGNTTPFGFRVCMIQHKSSSYFFEKIPDEYIQNYLIDYLLLIFPDDDADGLNCFDIFDPRKSNCWRLLAF